MEFNFTPFPVLETERLILRELNDDDVNVIFKLRSNPITNKYIERELPTKLSQAEDFINKITQEQIDKKSITWLLTLKEDKTAIGSICIWNINHGEQYGEVGYSLLPEYFKKGFMSEALKSVLDFGFHKMKLKTMEAFTHKNNTASKTLLEKHQFVFQSERREKGFENNRIFKLTK